MLALPSSLGHFDLDTLSFRHNILPLSAKPQLELTHLHTNLHEAGRYIRPVNIADLKIERGKDLSIFCFKLFFILVFY